MSHILNKLLSTVIRICSEPYYILVIVYFLIFNFVFTSAAYRQYLNLETAMFDFGLEHQVVWNTSQGRLFASYPEVKNYLGDHFSIITLFPALIYRLLPGPLTLFVIQTLAIGFFLLGLWLITYKISKSKILALSVLICASFYGGIRGLLLFDYHAIAFAPALLIWGIYFYYIKKNFWIASGFFILASLCKEDVGLFVAMFGIWAFLTQKDKRALLYTVYGFFISFFALFYLIPCFRSAPSDTLDRYKALGDSPKHIIKTILTKPKFMFNYLYNEVRINYIIKIFSPLFLFSIGSFALITIVPSLLINLLNGEYAQLTLQFQYDAMITTGVWFSFVMIVEKIINYSNSKQLANTQFLCTLLGIILFLTNLPSIWTNKVWEISTKPLINYEIYKEAISLKKQIPENAILGTSNHLGGLYGDREKLQVFEPEWIKYTEKPDYILMRKSDGNIGTPEAQNRFNEKIFKENYKLVYESKDLIMIKKD